MPVASIRPIIEKTFSVLPNKWRNPTVATSEKGIAIPTAKVGPRRRRKASRTSTARIPPTMPALRSPERDWVISSAEFLQIRTSTPPSAGSCWNSSIFSITRRTVATVFASEAFRISRLMAYSPFRWRPELTSGFRKSISATSASKIPRSFTGNFRNSSMEPMAPRARTP